MSVLPYPLNPSTSIVLNATKFPAQGCTQLEQKNPLSQKIPKIETRRTCRIVRGILKAIASTIPVISLRMIALFVSIFGEKGKILSEKIEYRTKKIQLIYITHNLVKANYLRDPSFLCCSKNLGTKQSIRTEEDLQKSREFLNRLIDPEYARQKYFTQLNPDQISLIQNYPLQGAVNTGICYGASLFLIKILLANDVHSEAELINLIKPYKKGFPAEVTALQNAFKAFRIETVKAEYKQRLQELKQQQQTLLQQLETINPATSHDEYSRMTDELKVLSFAQIKLKQDMFLHDKNRKQYVASLINLKLSSSENNVKFYTQIDKKETQAEFNRLPDGYYQFVYSMGKKSGHSIVYIKKEFGSYFADPNYGLFKCKTSNPAEELYQFLKKHYSRDIENQTKFTISYELV